MGSYVVRQKKFFVAPVHVSERDTEGNIETNTVQMRFVKELKARPEGQSDVSYFLDVVDGWVSGMCDEKGEKILDTKENIQYVSLDESLRSAAIKTYYEETHGLQRKNS